MTRQFISGAVVFSLAMIGEPDAFAQQDAEAATANSPVVFTTQQDHQNMLDQLGITKLRPGRSANADSPNAANYDEAQANPYPELPEILKTATGETVDTPELWWKKRRPEIVELLESEVYGRIPKNVPDVKWEVRQTREVEAGGKPAIQKELVGVVDNSACPEIEVNISMSLTLPKDAKGPVPVLMSFGWTPFEMERSGFGGFGRRGDGPRPPSKQDKLIAAGWGCAMLNPSTCPGRLWRLAASTLRPRCGSECRAHRSRSDSRHHRTDKSWPAAYARSVGCAACMGLGSFTSARLSRNRARGRLETSRHRGRVAVRQSGIGRDGV